MNRRSFLVYSSSACACCLTPSLTKAQITPDYLDFCTELYLEPSESATWVETEWEEPPKNAEEAASIAAKRWKPSRKVLRVDFLNNPPQATLKDRVKAAASGWEDHMDLKFEFGAGEPDILINFGPGLGHSSFIGTDSLGKSKNGLASMNFGWTSPPIRDRDLRRVVLHEFGHALSLIHEHQSPAANIPWKEKAVFKYYRLTHEWSDDEIKKNIFAHYSKSRINMTRYDSDSIMHYHIPSALVEDPAYATSWNTRLSELDKKMADFLFPA